MTLVLQHQTERLELTPGLAHKRGVRLRTVGTSATRYTAAHRRPWRTRGVVAGTGVVVWWFPYAVGAPLISLLSWGTFLYFRYVSTRLALTLCERGNVRMKIGLRATEVVFIRSDPAAAAQAIPDNLSNLSRKEQPAESSRAGTG